MPAVFHHDRLKRREQYDQEMRLRKMIWLRKASVGGPGLTGHLWAWSGLIWARLRKMIWLHKASAGRARTPWPLRFPACHFGATITAMVRVTGAPCGHILRSFNVSFPKYISFLSCQIAVILDLAF